MEKDSLAPTGSDRFSDDILSILSNLSAIDEERAVPVDNLAASWISEEESKKLGETLDKLISSGYVRKIDNRVFLTGGGLIRAMSSLS